MNESWLFSKDDLDDEQYAITRLSDTDNAIVEGSAGSGKTALALFRAKELQDQGQSFTVMVYTKALSEFISAGVRQLGLKQTNVIWYHRWRYTLRRPDIRHLIIDEVQDFNTEWLSELRRATQKSIVVMGDSAQRIYKDKGALGMSEVKKILGHPTYKLNNNHRLTKKVAKFAQYLNNQGDDLEKRCSKSGFDIPVIKTCNSRSEELDFILNEIKIKDMRSAGILVSTNAEVRRIKEHFEDNNISAEYRYRDENDIDYINLDFSSSLPKVMTYHSSKGLQFDTVFLPFCEADWYDKYKDALYVAITRTTNSLYCTHTYSLTPFFAKIPSHLYKVV